jgi:pyruvate kinase
MTKKTAAEISIIATLGPSSLNEETLKRIDHSGASFVRINLSHTPIERLEPTIELITRYIKAPLILDTEGSQVRTGMLDTGQVTLKSGEHIWVGCNTNCKQEFTIALRPVQVLPNLQVGDLLFVDFDTAILRVDDVNESATKHRILCYVITGGVVGSNKAVTVENQCFSLPALSTRDLQSIELAKKHGIDKFTLSFIDNAREVAEFRALYPEANAISKIETISGVQNLSEILEVSDGILIDRGDLSRELSLEKIPLAQKIICLRANQAKKPVYVATNLLDTMMVNRKPSRAEVNDIVNTILDGATGLVLAAETAIGQHPVETINFVRGLANHIEPISRAHLSGKGGTTELISILETERYTSSPMVGSCLISPHGGSLVNRVLKTQPLESELSALECLNVSKEVAMDAEQIALGAFSPLRGFMNEAELNAVSDSMRLPSGVVWTIPILLQINATDAKRIKGQSKILLREAETNLPFATLLVSDIYKLDKERIAKSCYGTTDSAHPGVKHFFEEGDYAVAGAIDLISRLPQEFKHYQYSPVETRKIFETKGWTRVVGFHTRNAVHRSHEFAQRRAAELGECEGIFLHPVVGKKKSGDFQAAAIIRSYEIMVEKIYSPERALLGTFATYSRYLGPREAVFTALCRQNFGCSHFVVGRDHTGVGNFYDPKASHQIFDKFEDLQIEAVRIGDIGYDTSGNEYRERPIGSIESSKLQSISGTQVREMLCRGEAPPEWFMRPEISSAILEMQRAGQSIFVE